MTELHDLIARHFELRSGELIVGGVPVGEIAREVGTPLYVYDRRIMEDSVRSLRRAFPPSFDLHYSIKANPNRAILGVFLQLGCGLEVASAGEYFQAVAAGCEPSRILFAGPGKTAAELAFVVSGGIGEIHVESLHELETLAAIVRERGRPLAVAIRVNPGDEALGGAMRMGGQPSQFGVDEEQLDLVLDRALGEPSLTFQGIHLFAGTQILDHETLVRQYAKGFQIAQRAARRAGKPLRTLDFGGGLGIPYHKGERPLDLEAAGRGVRELVEQWGACPELAGTRFVVEPGRFLVGQAGIYVCRVIDVKSSRGKKYVIVDGGMHHHLAASGNLGQVIKRSFPIGALTKLDRPLEQQADVVGPLCTPLDVLGRATELPSIEPGDLVGVFQSGAYARTSSPLGFLSHPSPPEVLAHEGEYRVIRLRAKYEDSLRDQPPAGTAAGDNQIRS